MAKDIPTSNKPKAEEKEAEDAKETVTRLVDTKEFQAKVKEAISEVKSIYDSANEEACRAEERKIQSVYKTGKQMLDLMEKLDQAEKAGVVKQFHTETGIDPTYFYVAMQAAGMFTKEQVDKCAKNGVTFRTFKAIIGIKSQAMREKAMQHAIDEGWNDSDIRRELGKKGARKEATDKNTIAKNKKKPPVRVVEQALDRVTVVGVSIKSCMDAILRLAECKNDEERKKTIKAILDLRSAISGLDKEFTAFLKFTANFGKKA